MPTGCANLGVDVPVKLSEVSVADLEPRLPYVFAALLRWALEGGRIAFPVLA